MGGQFFGTNPRIIQGLYDPSPKRFLSFIWKEANLLAIWIKTFRNRSLKYLFWMRFSAYRGFLFPFCKLRQEHFADKFSLDIPPSTKIGYGLYLGHAMSIVVNRTAVIGNNVNLSQMLNIGSNHHQAAYIGDNVYIGPQVCVVENVHIGSNALIGCGSVVVRDIPPCQTAVGAPCKPIGPCKYDYISNKWPIDCQK